MAVKMTGVLEHNYLGAFAADEYSEAVPVAAVSALILGSEERTLDVLLAVLSDAVVDLLREELAMELAEGLLVLAEEAGDALCVEQVEGLPAPEVDPLDLFRECRAPLSTISLEVAMGVLSPS